MLDWEQHGISQVSHKISEESFQPHSVITAKLADKNHFRTSMMKNKPTCFHCLFQNVCWLSLKESEAVFLQATCPS